MRFGGRLSGEQLASFIEPIGFDLLGRYKTQRNSGPCQWINWVYKLVIIYRVDVDQRFPLCLVPLS